MPTDDGPTDSDDSVEARQRRANEALSDAVERWYMDSPFDDDTQGPAAIITDWLLVGGAATLEGNRTIYFYQAGPGGQGLPSHRIHGLLRVAQMRFTEEHCEQYGD